GSPVLGAREDPLGFEDPIQIEWWHALARLSEALTSAGIPYVYVDSEAAPRALRGYRVVYSPSYELMGRDHWHRLVDVAAHGATLLYGPRLPTLDDRGRPLEAAAPKQARCVDPRSSEEAHALVEALAEELGLERPFRVEPPPLETAAHEDARGVSILFVINPGKSMRRGRLSLPEPMALRDVLSDERFEGEGTLELPMPPQTCRMLQVERPEAPEPRRRPSARRAR
ncbi:MAG: hypothetical protein OEY14_11810, partial [Myxococcales bacterium]|nr:hypothetical protein [Myxococcales bacterium]